MVKKEPPTDNASRPEDLFDSWAGWKPVWSIPRKKKHRKKSIPITPHDFQENQSPTEAVEIRLTAERKAHRGQRRIVDARLWDAMVSSQQDAALKIEHAFNTMSRGIGYRISDPSRISFEKSYNNENEHQAYMVNFYFKWAKKCTEEKLLHAAVIDILVFGKSCRSVDRERRMRNGWARTNLLECLDIYCEMNGWPTSKDNKD